MVPSGWEKHPVGKICSSIVPGRNKPKQFGGDIAWVTTPEITGKFIPSSVQENYISEETIKECGGKIVPKGAVVMAAVGDLGLIAITKEEVVLNQQLHAFVCSSKINNEFLAYWLGTQTPYMESVASKTTILYLNKTNCESIPVLVPPILEQQKIANILSTWDKAISTTERLIDNSTQQKKALMQQLLTGKKRLLDDEGKRFVGEWNKKTLADICSKTISYGIVQTGEHVKDGVPCVRVVDLTQKTVSKNDMITTSDEINQSYNKTILESGEVMMALRGVVGLVRLVNEDLVGSNITRGLARLAPKNELIKSDFFLWILRSSYVKNELMRKVGGSSLQEISLTALRKVQIPFPSLQEQQKIANVLTNADKVIELLEQQLADLHQEKKALMQVLLTGKKRVVVDGTF
ncbi:restriction endonuclease subunit S [Psychrobacter immobilis]|uniref:restriction endonuclease subunit S n=1 Tax=Psychrobacter immobilis TaxID=498 RepID=UPI00191899F2|nr:restriction endonuclease subunit S [Psychrobacter immobilis]